jgi:predicted NBD/HSP70 family sugar kinase
MRPISQVIRAESAQPGSTVTNVTLAEPSPRGLGNESLRRENLANVLRLVHRAAGAGRSRSELTALTGLNRSTIAALVGELEALRLVDENDPPSNVRVGRPSPIVRTSDHLIGVTVNPETDAVTVALVGLGGRVIERRRVPSPVGLDSATAVRLAAEAVRALLADRVPPHRVVGIGVAIPGQVRADDGLVRLAPHLNWVDEPFTSQLGAELGLPIAAANDATLGVRAESTFGGGRGIHDVVYLNGGASGVGGGVVVGGLPLTGADGYAGELGHTLVNSSGQRCHCGAIGCLETEVARAPLLQLVGLADADADRLEDALSAATDPAVRAEVRRQLGFLAVALRNAINTFNPQRVLLGGFLAALYGVEGDYLVGLVAQQTLRASGEGVEIARAELGSDILIVGAAELAFTALFADPASLASPTPAPS